MADAFDDLGRDQRPARLAAATAWRLGLAVAVAMSAVSAISVRPKQAHASDEEGSARAKLEALRKDRAKNAAAAKAPGGKTAAAKSNDDGKHPWASPDDVNYVDSLLKEEWAALKFPVSEACTDGEFVRRLTLDLLGRIPTIDETLAYMADKQPGHKERLLNRLLASEEYGKNAAVIWANLMITDGRANGANQDINPPALRSWLEAEFNRNTPWNEIVTKIISAQGRWDENGAVNFIIANNERNGNSTKTTSYMTKLFLCVQTQCTECHDHPWNEWRQDQFHGLNAFFTGTRERRVTKVTDNGQNATDYYELAERPMGELTQSGSFFERRNGIGVFIPPTYIDGRTATDIAAGKKALQGGRPTADSIAGEVVADLERDLATRANNADGQPQYLRELLAKAITADDNKYFARAMVNRLWHHHFGHSFIKNVDDFDNGQDEPSMPALLDRLAGDFRKHHYDLKRLTKWICMSDAYALSTKIRGKANDESVGFFTYQLVKPMSPETLYDSLMTLTQMNRTAASKADNEKTRDRFVREILQTFGSESMQTTAPKYQGTITQGLMMMNSPLMTQATSCVPGSFLHKVVTDNRLGDVEKADQLYLAGLSRHMNGNERQRAATLLGQARNAQQQQDALSDVLWVIVNSSEFILNH